MATRAIFTPFSAEFPASNYPGLLTINARPALAFDAGTAETCYWTSIAPQGLTGPLTAIISYIMASATSGKVDFTVALAAITSGDSTDLDTSTSFATANTITALTVPGTAGYLQQVSCTLTNDDAIAAADYFRIALVRDAADATNDTATGDCYVLALELRDSV